DDDLLAGCECSGRQEGRGGVVVRDDAVLRAGELGQQTRRVTVPLAATAGSEVVFDAHRASGINDRGEGGWRERCAAEVGLKYDAGRVEDAAKRTLVSLTQPVARRIGRAGFIESRAGGACFR